MTLDDPLTRTRDLLAAGWPMTTINRARRVAAQKDATMTDDTAPTISVELHDGPSLADLRRDAVMRAARVQRVLDSANLLSTHASMMSGANLTIEIVTDRRDVIAARDLPDAVPDELDSGSLITRFDLDDGGGLSLIERLR